MTAVKIDSEVKNRPSHCIQLVSSSSVVCGLEKVVDR